jgi:hypothetical protein
MLRTRVISTAIDSLSRRVIKFLGFGKDDVQTALESYPYGVDSNPIKNMVAVYSPTSIKGKGVIIGYLNVKQLANVGEFRTFSTDANGNLKFYTWLKNDGTMELGGSTKNLARYQELEVAFNELKGDHNDLVNAFNAHMHATAGSGPPSLPTPGSGIPALPSTADITGSKIDEIKTL